MLAIPILEISGVGEARRLAVKLAQQCGFSEILLTNIAIVVTEIANNLIKHTPLGGEIIFYTTSNEQYSAINIIGLDKGPGITNLSECLVDGYSTAGTQGTGLGAIQRLATSFDIYTIPENGTVLWAQLTTFNSPKTAIEKSSPDSHLPFDIGAICIPVKGEEVCGDGWAVDFSSTMQGTCLVVDGLGHGEGAFEASREAIKTFYTNKNDLPLATLFQKIHLALNKTRGAAAAISKLNFAQQQVEYVGIGNIGTVLLSKEKKRSLISLNGIVGHGIKKVHSYSYPLYEDSVLIMYSDGLISHWDLEQYPGLLNKPAHVIAGLLYRDYKRGRDDVTIVVIKHHSKK